MSHRLYFGEENHLLRRAHQNAIRNKLLNAEEFATAHEENCELLGRSVFMDHFHENKRCDTAHMCEVCVVLSMVGLGKTFVVDDETIGCDREPHSPLNNGSRSQPIVSLSFRQVRHRYASD